MMDRRRLGLWVLAVSIAIAVPAAATMRFGPLQISGNLQTQNIVRHPDAQTYQFIQNRNVARLQLTYDWLQGGKLMEKYTIPFIRDSKVFFLARGVYDSVYDTTPGFAPRFDIHGNAFQGNLNLPDALRSAGLSQNTLRLRGLSRDARDSIKFDGSQAPREAYVDLRFRDVPLSIRAGKQQIVWGETDNFRMLDRANSLDLTWHFQQEIPGPALGWDEIRQPFWMIKLLYELGDVWKFSQSFIEGYWNPGDWRPAKQAFLPRPWGLPFLNPLTNRLDGAFRAGFCGPSPSGNCTQLLKNTKLFQKGDWHRNPADNSQFGVRYHGIAPFGMEFTLNYFYQRFAGDDGTNYAPLKGLPNNTRNRDITSGTLIPRTIFPAEAYAPYIHTIGASANYSDDAYTQTVFRMETIVDLGIPFFDVGRETVIDSPALPGITKKDMWKGMVGFDRQTWIRWINKKTTVFLTGQFFWHHVLGAPNCNAATVANTQNAAKKHSCLVGGLDLPSTARLGTAGSGASYRDKIRDWEALITFAAFTFYKGGSVVPTIGIALDPVNQFSMEPFWAVDYVVRDDFVVNLAQRYFVTPRGHHTPIFETWGLAGLNAGRSETSLRLTYQY